MILHNKGILMKTFNPGDRVHHVTVPYDNQAGTVIRYANESIIIVDWDEGTNIRRITGPEACHNAQFLILIEPAFSTYDPLQAGDTDEDV